jgi:separase
MSERWLIDNAEMNVHLLGLLGLVLLKVKFLEVLKRLCERQLLVSADC